MLAVNSQTRTLTLDREITLPSSGTTLISLVDGSGNPVSVEVQSVTDGVKVKVSRVPDGVAEYSVWGLKLPTLRQRLFRCVSIRENDDGTYAITAVQHVPEKEAIVDNGAHFDGDQSGTVNGVTPPAVQHLTAEVTADSGEYQVLARWDTPKVVKGVSFMLRLTVAADEGSERLVSTARTAETTYRFRQLALGNYRLTVRAVNAWGQQGEAETSARNAGISASQAEESAANADTSAGEASESARQAAESAASAKQSEDASSSSASAAAQKASESSQSAAEAELS
ncbi:phage tail tip protein J-related protein, partial [Escherichia coli]